MMIYKSNYDAPKVETVELEVEQGFAFSGKNPTDSSSVDDIFDWIGDWQ